MSKNTTLAILGFFIFLSGLFLLVNTEANITGAVVGVAIPSGINLLLGLVLFIFGSALFLSAVPGEEVEEEGLELILNKEVKKEERAKCEVLVDSDFAVYIHQHKDVQDKYKNFFGGYTHRLLPRVRRELTRRSGKTNQPLVSLKTFDYLRRGESRVDYAPRKESIDTVLKYWREATPQGRTYPGSEGRFKESADMEILCYALENKDEKVIYILTNNYSEIGKIAERINGLRSNIRIKTSKDVFEA